MAIDINIPSQVKTFANLAGFPVTGAVKTIYIAEDTNKTYRWTGSAYVEISASAGGSASWGSITGTLSSQTDLQNALNTKEPTITAGTSSQYYRGDKSFQTLDKTAVGLDNVDNTTDANKPVSTATQTALNAKQDTLVSATNIKTINGADILGSGDLTISGGASGVHGFIKPQTGQSVSSSINAAALSGTLALTANRLYTNPFIPAQTITCSSLYINVSSLVVGALSRILIYSDLNGLPDTKLYESADLDCSTIGVKTATTTFTFTAGVTYWLTIHTNSTPQLIAILSSQLIPVRLSGTSVSSYFVRSSVATFGSAPSPFGAVTGSSTSMPLIGITI